MDLPGLPDELRTIAGMLARQGEDIVELKIRAAADELDARRWAQNEDAVRIANLRGAVGELLNALGPDFDQNRRAYFDEMTALAQKDRP